MDNWERFNETRLPEKEEFYSNLYMEDITDAEYMHVKTVCKDFEIKNLSEYYDFYLKSDTLLLVDVFENFRKMCLKNYHLDPVLLDWHGKQFKKTEVKLGLLTDIDILLMIEKNISGGICHTQFINMQKLMTNI